MSKKILFTGILIVLFCSSGITQGIAIGPQVGFQKARGADEGNLIAGVAMRLNLLFGLGVEGSIGYRQEKYAEGALTVKSWPIQVTGLYYLLPVIYGAVGAGWYNTTFDFSRQLNEMGFEDETHREFGWHFGGGIELPLGGTILTADIRYVFLDYDFQQIPGTGDLNNDFYVIVGGILFKL